MESAAEAGRRAVNFLLDRAGSNASPAAVFTLFDPPEFQQLKAIDADRYANGQPNLFDTTGLVPPQGKQLLDSLGLGPLLQSLGLA